MQERLEEDTFKALTEIDALNDAGKQRLAHLSSKPMPDTDTQISLPLDAGAQVEQLKQKLMIDETRQVMSLQKQIL